LTKFDNHEDQASNHKELEWEDYSSDFEFEFSDSSVKQSAKCIAVSLLFNLGAAQQGRSMLF
jgi:hypothetical protein